MSTMISTIHDAFARIESDLAVLKWMVGFNLAMTVAVMWKVFSA